MSGKNILILGGGVGGLVAANELRRQLPGEHRVVLVEKNPQHAFAASFLWLMTGDRRPEQITRDVRRLVRPGVEVILAEVQAIDLTNRRGQTSMQTGGYDYFYFPRSLSPCRWPARYWVRRSVKCWQTRVSSYTRCTN